MTTHIFYAKIDVSQTKGGRFQIATYMFCSHSTVYQIFLNVYLIFFVFLSQIRQMD